MLLPIRGGDYNNGANAGLFALNLNNARTNANGNIGFRPALPSFSPEALGPRCQGRCVREKGAAPLPARANAQGERNRASCGW